MSRTSKRPSIADNYSAIVTRSDIEAANERHHSINTPKRRVRRRKADQPEAHILPTAYRPSEQEYLFLEYMEAQLVEEHPKELAELEAVIWRRQPHFKITPGPMLAKHMKVASEYGIILPKRK